MAGDLIPPPSPAGRPEPGHSTDAFRESELLRTDAQVAADAGILEPEVGVEPAAASQYKSRFGLLTGALIGVGLAALVIVTVIVSSGDPIKAPAWSAWKPDSDERDIQVQEIAQYVGAGYRLDDGDQLVTVDAQPLELDGQPLSVVLRSTGKGEGADVNKIRGDTILYVLHGLGARGSIDSGEPSEKRLRLVQREALELALYTFKYVKDVDNVVTFIPPAPPGKVVPSATPGPSATPTATPGPLAAAAAESGSAAGQPLPSMLFLPGDLEAPLKVPLAATLPAGDPPRPSTISPETVSSLGQFAAAHSFSASVITDQTGAGFLVLDRLSASAAAQEALRSTQKA